MSAHPLPEDMADWPEDANALLGVTYGVSPRDLRRAYHRLIRIYKPEQHPEQFRRIREAYEYLLQIAELFAPRTELPEPPPADEPTILPAPSEPTSDGDVAEWTADSPQLIEDEAETWRPFRPEEEGEELWEQAVAGQPAAAYERLAQLTQQYAGRIELYLRLYWLRTLFPELDARRVPADWLVSGLLATGFAGPLRELYREEVANDPAEALSERYERLLDAAVAPETLADLIEWRFRATVRQKRWKTLSEDLRRLRGRLGLEGDPLWLRLLFDLSGMVAWTDEERAFAIYEVCRCEIARHEHLAQKLSFLFDRHDLLVSAVAGWQDLYRSNRVPASLLQLLAASWSRPFAEMRASLMEVLDKMAVSPGVWLDHLEVMNLRAPSLLSLFGELLDRFEQTQQIAREPGDRSGLALAFLAQLTAHYKAERNRLLMFCLREDIAPEEMAEAAGGTWASTLMADWPLRYVCRACRLFWA